MQEIHHASKSLRALERRRVRKCAKKAPRVRGRFRKRNLKHAKECSIRERFSRTGRTRPALARVIFRRRLHEISGVAFTTLEHSGAGSASPCQPLAWLGALSTEPAATQVLRVALGALLQQGNRLHLHPHIAAFADIQCSHCPLGKPRQHDRITNSDTHERQTRVLIVADGIDLAAQ